MYMPNCFIPPYLLSVGWRIKKCGGFIAWNSLGQPHVNGRLAMTRSIGDLDLKKYGVIAEPETKRVQVRSMCIPCFHGQCIWKLSWHWNSSCIDDPGTSTFHYHPWLCYPRWSFHIVFFRLLGSLGRLLGLLEKSMLCEYAWHFTLPLFK